MRTRRVRANRLALQIGLASLIAGTSVWATHFVAMLAYDPQINHAFDLMRTAQSLLIVLTGIALSFHIASKGRGWIYVVASGTLLGLSISSMHYVGMSAYRVAGEVIHDHGFMVASVLLSAVFGCLTIHRLLHPTTRYCWMGGAFAMVLLTITVHFTGMAALEIRPDPSVQIPFQWVSDTVMGVIVMTVVLFLFLIGFGGFLIEIKIAEETRTLVRNAALFDSLTHLPNRANLQICLKEFAQDVTQNLKKPFAVLTIDIDRFRLINARMGNATGDAVLDEIASRLRCFALSEDFLARTSSDEFVLIKTGMSAQDSVDASARAIGDALTQPLELISGPLEVTVSIGSARCPHDAALPYDLLQKSQYAMKQAKADHDGKICHYDAVMDQKSREHDALVSDLRKALVNNQFFLNFQQQNDIRSRDVTGFEVLCRWRHPVRGLVPPSVFIPIAEDYGLIKNLGIWVLREACNEAVQWEHPYRIAVNVAPQQLSQPDFVDLVDDILATSGLSPERLELEITEASIIDDQTNVLAVMHRLKKRGISIAMDDFGTGYSSLAALQIFPFDKIKIDSSFIRDVYCDPQKAAIVRSTLLLGASLGIPVLAEGIENAAERDFLAQERCCEAQGFFFGHPMDRNDVRAITGYAAGLQQAG
ncbi:putative bifunctional diguanylate cyclase/phosphodiesterase [Cognatiyoonia koreensis]|nr:EAL domain-containing protein [Cognatiyoonia koreensis]